MGDDQGGLSPLHRVRAAVRGIDRAGRFRARDAGPVRAAVAELKRSGTEFDHPSQLLGPWTELPPTAQRALRDLAQQEISRVMDYHPWGPIWPWTARALITISRFLKRRSLMPRVARAADHASAGLWKGPSNLRERIHARLRVRAWQRGRRITAADLLASVGRRPRWLLGDYATAVRVDPRCRGFFHDPERNVAFGYLIGIDLIPAPDGVWCVEANLNTAFNEARRELLEPEPAVQTLFRAARDMRATTVWWHGMDRSELRPWLIRELEEGGRRDGLMVVIREDYRVPPRLDLPPGMVPPVKRLTSPVPGADTLVLRRNGYGVGTDYVIANKEPFIRGIDACLREAGESKVRVPTMARVPDVVPPITEASLPNLVYKYPDFGKGEGVYFLRVRNPSEAWSVARSLDASTGERPGLFQPFVCSRLLPGRRVYDVRCELFVTPLAVYYVFGTRREATRGLPMEAGEGLLKATGVYTSNLATGGRFAPIDPAEEVEVREAAIAIGEALRSLLLRGFDVGR